MLLSTPHCTGQAPTRRDYPVPNTKFQVEKADLNPLGPPPFCPATAYTVDPLCHITKCKTPVPQLASVSPPEINKEKIK